MKKILLAVLLFAFIYAAEAQQITDPDIKASVESAVKNTQNPKKSVKVKTWLKLAKEYINAYDKPYSNLLRGTYKQEVQLLMGAEKVLNSEMVEISGEPMTKDVYKNKNLYYNSNGQLTFIEITEFVCPDALNFALEAYKQAYVVDSKRSKTKDIKDGIAQISQKYMTEAYTKYSIGDNVTASKLFEAAALASEVVPSNVIDTNSVYNAGFTAYASGDWKRAKPFYERCVQLSYFGEDGDVYAKLGDIEQKLENSSKARTWLEEGFTTFPQSQSILIGLINYYVSSGEDSSRLFTLIEKAQKNEPNNASLYYVEGNIYEKMGNYDRAVLSYRKCAEINPEYEFGYIGEGVLFYNKALEIQEKANEELNDAKYNVLIKEFESSLKSCLEPFEKAYELSKNESIKVSVAEYLKNTYYRFREESPKYMQSYEKYADIVKNGRQESK